jgi:hypothetical protein
MTTTVALCTACAANQQTVTLTVPAPSSTVTIVKTATVVPQQTVETLTGPTINRAQSQPTLTVLSTSTAVAVSIPVDTRTLTVAGVCPTGVAGAAGCTGGQGPKTGGVVPFTGAAKALANNLTLAIIGLLVALIL